LYVVTAVEQEAKKRGFYRICCKAASGDGDGPELSVHEDILIRHKLFKGAALDEAMLRIIMKEDGRQRAYAAGLAYLGYKPRTRKELERYLARKSFDEEDARLAVERLEREGYIDDRAYAQAFAHQRAVSHYKGSKLIRQELLQRGIGRDTADAAARALDPASELETAARLARKKWPGLKGEYRERCHKLAGFLLRRGFPHDVVRTAVRAAAEEEETFNGVDWLDN